MKQAADFFALPEEAKAKVANVKGPVPQRGFSRTGEEQTSKLRKENLAGQESWDELRDARVSEIPNSIRTMSCAILILPPILCVASF
jgi:isopenicillin N synthase-like dioxygenase